MWIYYDKVIFMISHYFDYRYHHHYHIRIHCRFVRKFEFDIDDCRIGVCILSAKGNQYAEQVDHRLQFFGNGKKVLINVKINGSIHKFTNMHVRTFYNYVIVSSTFNNIVVLNGPRVGGSPDLNVFIRFRRNGITPLLETYI